jgi:hypothetical protein
LSEKVPATPLDPERRPEGAIPVAENIGVAAKRGDAARRLGASLADRENNSDVDTVGDGDRDIDCVRDCDFETDGLGSQP